MTSAALSRQPIGVASKAGFVALALALYLLSSCGGDDQTNSAASPTAAGDESATSTESASVPEGNPETLGEWAQLVVADGVLRVEAGVVPYGLNTPLFTDYAHKLRTVSLPAGAEPASYDATDVFSFPVGTVITKTFYYPLPDPQASDTALVAKTDPDAASPAEPLKLDEVRLLETRVLVHRAEGWEALPYVWDEAQTEATLSRAGDLIPLTLVDADATESPFVYVVPDVNQCSACHAENHSSGATQPIGPKARHINTDIDYGDGAQSQLAYWQDAGILTGAPAPDEIPMAAVWDDDSVSLEDRARAYLDINCAHCHNSQGAADTSGLFLEPSTEVGRSLGVCKTPIAAGTGTGGRSVSIAPGEPDESIFMFRLESTDPGAMMPELGRSLSHVEGAQLIAAWIESLTGSC